MEKLPRQKQAMNESAMSTDRDGDGEEQTPPENLVARSDDAEELQRVIDELFPSSDQDEELQPVLKDLVAKGEQGENLQIITELLLSVRRRWVGPIPSPERLRQFEEVQSGLADRIVSMAERQQDHRMLMESSALDIDHKIVDSDVRQSYLGTVLGFIFAMAFLAIGGWLAANGHWRTGLPFGLIPPGILFTMFAYQFWPMLRKPRDDRDAAAEDDR